MGWVVVDWPGQELILAEDGQGIHLQTFGQVVRAAQEIFAPCFVVQRPDYDLPP